MHAEMLAEPQLNRLRKKRREQIGCFLTDYDVPLKQLETFEPGVYDQFVDGDRTEDDIRAIMFGVKEKIQAPRRAEIIAALENLGLELRGDSKLCQTYIECGAFENWTVTKIAWRMAQMNFLHQYTAYSPQCNDEIEEELSYKGSLSSMGGAQEICAGIERSIVSALPGGTFPLRWPWLLPVWTTENSSSWSPQMRVNARELLKALWFGPLSHLAFDTRKAVIEAIIRAYASVQLDAAQSSSRKRPRI
jgi:hypothetical protein